MQLLNQELKILNLYKIRKYFTSAFVTSDKKELSHFHQSTPNEEHIKISIFQKHTWKVIKKHYWKSGIYKILARKLLPEVSENLTDLAAFTFLLYCFIMQIFLVYHFEHTPIVYPQYMDSNSEIVWMFTQRYYQWKIKCLTLPCLVSLCSRSPYYNTQYFIIYSNR